MTVVAGPPSGGLRGLSWLKVKRKDEKAWECLVLFLRVDGERERCVYDALGFSRGGYLRG
jgi:hypothetical protein